MNHGPRRHPGKGAELVVGRRPHLLGREDLAHGSSAAQNISALAASCQRRPKHLAREVRRNWREPAYEEFRPRTAYSLQNAFTSSFKLLEPDEAAEPTGDQPNLRATNTELLGDDFV